MNRKKDEISREVRQRTAALRQAIAAKSILAGGTIHTRTKVCGRKTCACATDKEKRHGPYHEWSRLEDGRLVHTILSAEQAGILQQAIDDYREVAALISRWQAETVKAVLGLRKRKGQR